MDDAALIDPRNRVQPVLAENIEIGHRVWVKGGFRLRQLNYEPAKSVVIFRKPSGKHVIATECGQGLTRPFGDQLFFSDCVAEATFRSGLTFQGSRASRSATVVAFGSCSYKWVKYACGLVPFARQVPTTL